MTARASVVIPTRGGAHRLPSLFRALADQRGADFDVVVVIDGDIDDSQSLVRRWATDLPLRAIVFPQNRGRSVALNAGFAEATGEVLLRCDDDLEPGPDHIATHIGHHLSPHPVGVIGLCPNVLPDTPYSRAYGASPDAIFRQQAYEFAESQRWRLWGANVSVTRETWERVGPYDVAYRAYGFEDVDWGYRLHTLGIPLVLDPRLEARHHGAATTTAIRAARAYHSGAAQRTFEKIHGDAPLGPATAGTGLWGRATHAVGRRLSAGSEDRLAAWADKAVGHLPPYPAEKVIAFTVESAAIAGRQRPQSLDLSI